MGQVYRARDTRLQRTVAVKVLHEAGALQIQRVHHLDLGVGAAFSLTDSFDVFGSFSRLVAGRNGHAMDRGITVGVSWGFRRGTPSAETAPATAPPADGNEAETEKREGTLLRCICQKS